MKKLRGGSYASAGVSLDAGEVFGGFSGKICQGSYGNSRYVCVYDDSEGHFRGPREYQFINLPDTFGITTAPDGIGTKTIIISASGKNKMSASNLLAMTAGDLTRWGHLPLVFINQLDVKSLGKPGSRLFNIYQRMMAGLGALANEQGYILLNGETAQMNDCVSSEFDDPEYLADHPVYNWSGTMIGVTHPDKFIDGSSISSGQAIVALRERGFRSNGASLLRKYLRQRYGKTWWKNDDARPVVKAMATPSALYDRFLATINGWHNSNFEPEIRMHGIAHLSGGSFESKLGDGLLYRRGFSAVLTNLWPPPKFLVDCVREMKIGNQEAYSVFSCGQGTLVILNPGDVERFCSRASDFGLQARFAGTIRSSLTGRNCSIQITSGFDGEHFFTK